MRTDLERRGYVFAESTRAMGMSLDDIRVPRPEVELGPSDWDEHRRIARIASGLLDGIDRSAFHVLVARLHGENVATAVAVDHEGDCGIYNVGTLEHARRRGSGDSADRSSPARGARAGMPDGERAVDPDGRACLRRLGLPRPRSNPRVLAQRVTPIERSGRGSGNGGFAQIRRSRSVAQEGHQK